MTGSGTVCHSPDTYMCLFVEHEKERHGIAWTHCIATDSLEHLDVVRYGFIGLVLKVATCFAKTLKQSVKHHSRSRYHTGRVVPVTSGTALETGKRTPMTPRAIGIVL
ncbi:hypothetical protein FVEG_16097 [Fusarium verticillioides 7600]|uniref:Uncharacterized protein n=1 Tax=Gibberella moniliformis (strain M3125 / FGSC 7600) TaxID=334819 RepID=W7MRN8_GIBM7|nr:hypothetical protein FVEG_16097 [Fusarium verticillioides 7600]EWG47277.1 hypothetical protein FVEG_16097 [Fusarium verticillioides 7600]